MTKIMDWHNLYKNGWKGEIVPDAFQHPAKYSRRLIAEIYNHLFAEGLLQRGDSIVDPFGGVALGALDAMRLGLHWTGNELEEKFVHLGRANIELWNARYSSMPNWGSAQLLHGDSRILAQLVRARMAATRSSPPFLFVKGGCKPLGGREDETERMRGATGIAPYGSNDGQLSNLREGDFSDAIAYRAVVSSPPYEEARIGDSSGAANVGHSENYGQSAGQLGSMEGGDFSDAIAYRAAVSSPPFGMAQTGGGIAAAMRGESDYQMTTQLPTNLYQKSEHGIDDRNLGNLREGDFAAAIVTSPPYEEARVGDSSGAANVGHGENYGDSAGQLGSMTGGDFAAAVSSPPYEGSIDHAPGNKNWDYSRGDAPGNLKQVNYGISEGQIGIEQGDTFWLAARTIVAQTYSILTPGGVSAWVCKDFVRNKQRVPFCAQWLQLCEAVGFRHLYTARAWLIEENGTQLAHDGNHKSLRKERKSFFRRLNEKNGGPRIDWEEVIFMVK